MAQVTYQRAIGFMQRQTPLGALIVIGFHHIEGNHAAGVARHDGGGPRNIGQQRKAWLGRLRCFRALQA